MCFYVVFRSIVLFFFLFFCSLFSSLFIFISFELCLCLCNQEMLVIKYSRFLVMLACLFVVDNNDLILITSGSKCKFHHPSINYHHFLSLLRNNPLKFLFYYHTWYLFIKQLKESRQHTPFFFDRWKIEYSSCLSNVHLIHGTYAERDAPP